jgi:hypothetical protein
MVSDVDKIQRRIRDLVEIQKVYKSLLQNSGGAFSGSEFIQSLISRTASEISYYETFVNHSQLKDTLSLPDDKVELLTIEGGDHE